MPKIEIQHPEPDSKLARVLGEQFHQLIARVRNRAYDLSEQHQATQDAGLEDWLRAEAELLFPAEFEVKQDSDTYQLFVSLPGCAAQNLHVYAFKGGLVLTGEVSGQCSPADRGLIRTTRTVFYWWPKPTEARLPGATAELKHNRLENQNSDEGSLPVGPNETRSRGLRECQ